MPYKPLFKQVIALNKGAIDSSFTTIGMMQEQGEKALQGVLQQAEWLPAEGQKALQEWTASCARAREEFKREVDKSYEKVEAFLDNLK